MLTTATEFLSLFHLIRFPVLAIFWSSADFLAAAFFLYISKQNGRVRYLKFQDFACFELLLLAGIFLIVLVTGITAVISAPNNLDANSYHLPRVMHWIQNQSVAIYPVHVTRQIIREPGSDFILLHLLLLSGADYLANFHQWLSMVFSAIGASLLAQTLGASRRTQILAAFIAAALPMGIIQSTNSKNEFVFCVWMICFLNEFFKWQAGKFDWPATLRMGGALGLAMLTKGVTFFYAFPFLVCIFFLGLKSSGLKTISRLAVIAMVTLLINVGYFWRNFEVFKNPLGDNKKITSEMRSPVKIASNIIRHLAIHLGTPFPPVNQAMGKTIVNAEKNLNIFVKDPQTRRPVAFDIPGFTLEETETTNFLHFVLILAGLGFVFMRNKTEVFKHALNYELLLAAGFLLFSTIILWRAMSSRLHVPFFILSSPFIAIFIMEHEKKYFVYAVTALIAVWTLPYLFFNQLRPWFGGNSIFTKPRAEQYFARYPSLAQDYRQAADYIRSIKCDNVGLARLNPEYPFWVFIRTNRERKIRLVNVFVRNASRNEPASPPCAVVSSRRRNVKIPENYIIAKEFGVLSIHTPKKEIVLNTGVDLRR